MTTTPPLTNDVPTLKPAATIEPHPSTPEKRSKGWLAFLIVPLVGATMAATIYDGISSRVQAETRLENVTQASRVPYVTVTRPMPGSESGEISLPGNTEAFIDTPIYARTSGYLKSWYADIGTHVKAGELLAVIETPEIDQQLQQAQADLKDAQANLQISQATDRRYEALLNTAAVSREETDQADADLRSKQALVASGEANVRRLQQLQDFEKIYAPFDGVITARNTDIGALIQAGDNTTPKELFHLAAISRLRIYVSVPEVYSQSVTTGAKVTLTVDSLPGTTFVGTIVRNSDAIDPVTRTLNVEVDVDNPTGRLLPGAYAFVHLKLPATAGSVTIPSNTLLFRSEGLRVGVVHDGYAKLVPITIGHDYGSSVEVTSGLTPDDAVIVDPSDSLTDGSAVQIAQSTPAGATP
jgi:RND family efflux transporter MFP subunit